MSRDLTLQQLIDSLKRITQNSSNIFLPSAGKQNKIDVKSRTHFFIVDVNRKGNRLPNKTFDSKRVNLINSRKEFFEITLDEIKEVVEKHHDKTVEFVYTAAAEEYRESQAIKNKQLAPI